MTSQHGVNSNPPSLPNTKSLKDELKDIVTRKGTAGRIPEMLELELNQLEVLINRRLLEAKIDELYALTKLFTPTEIRMERPRYEVPPGAKYMEFPKAIGIEANQTKDELNNIIQAKIAELQHLKDNNEAE